MEYETLEDLNFKYNHELRLLTLRRLRVQQPQLQNIINKTTLAGSPLKKSLRKKLEKPMSKDLNVRKIYKTDKKESIYKQLDTSNSTLASGGPSDVLVMSRTHRN